MEIFFMINYELRIVSSLPIDNYFQLTPTQPESYPRKLSPKVFSDNYRAKQLPPFLLHLRRDIAKLLFYQL